MNKLSPNDQYICALCAIYRNGYNLVRHLDATSDRPFVSHSITEDIETNIMPILSTSLHHKPGVYYGPDGQFFPTIHEAIKAWTNRFDSITGGQFATSIDPGSVVLMASMAQYL